MTLSYIQIDYDIVDKLQALFDKYGIDFNYRKNIINKLVKYAENNRGLSDAYNNYDFISNSSNIYGISINDCKTWKRKLKSVGLHFSCLSDTIIYFKNGMVTAINDIVSLKDSLNENTRNLLVNKEVNYTYGAQSVESMEELEEKLESIDRNVNEYVTFFKSKTYEKYLDMLKKSLDKFKTEHEVYEASLNKITNGLLKLLDIENEN